MADEVIKTEAEATIELADGTKITATGGAVNQIINDLSGLGEPLSGISIMLKDLIATLKKSSGKGATGETPSADSLREAIEKAQKELAKKIADVKKAITDAMGFAKSSSLKDYLEEKFSDVLKALETAGGKKIPDLGTIEKALETINTSLGELPKIQEELGKINSSLDDINASLGKLEEADKKLYDEFVAFIGPKGEFGSFSTEVKGKLADILVALAPEGLGKAFLDAIKDMKPEDLNNLVHNSLVALRNNSASMDILRGILTESIKGTGVLTEDGLKKALSDFDGKIKAEVESGLKDFFKDFDSSKMKELGIDISKLAGLLTPESVEALRSLSREIGPAKEKMDSLLGIFSAERLALLDGIPGALSTVIAKLKPEFIDKLATKDDVDSATAAAGGAKAAADKAAEEASETKALIDLLLKDTTEEERAGLLMKIATNAANSATDAKKSAEILKDLTGGLTDEQKARLFKNLLEGAQKSKDVAEMLSELMSELPEDERKTLFTTLLSGAKDASKTSALLDELCKDMKPEEIAGLFKRLSDFLSSGDGKGGSVDPTPKPGPKPTPTPEPTPDPDPKTDAKKYKKGKFLKTALKESTILAEPPKRWYQKLASFTVRHPILTTLIGGGIGLALAGVGLGVLAATGLQGGILAAAASQVGGLAAGAGIGLVGGGVTALGTSLLPWGRKARLLNKNMKQYAQCANIDKSKQWHAGKQEKSKISMNQALAKLRAVKSKRGVKAMLLRSAIQFHSVARDWHKDRKRYKARQFKKEVDKAMTTKMTINNQEITKGKSYALNGYVEKKRKLRAKYDAGEITREEYEEDLADLAANYEAQPGGSAGLEDVEEQLFGDYEAADLIGKVEGEKSATMEAVLADIKDRRTTRVVTGIEERVVRDFDEWQAEIDKMTDIAKKEEEQSKLDEAKAEREKFENYMKSRGKVAEPMRDATPEEIEEFLKGGGEREP